MYYYIYIYTIYPGGGVYLVEGGDEDEADDYPQGDASDHRYGLQEAGHRRHLLEVEPPILCAPTFIRAPSDYASWG
jgi:hypothetical protein